MLFIFWCLIGYQKDWCFFSLADNFSKLNDFQKTPHELKDAFISYKTVQLSCCQRSWYRLRLISSVGVHSDFVVVVCMINLCLRWDDRVSHEVSSVPWERSFELVSLACSNSVLYGSPLRIDSMFFFKILNALSIYFQLKPVILKDAGVKTERGQWRADIEITFLSPFFPLCWKGKPMFNDPHQIPGTWFITWRVT